MVDKTTWYYQKMSAICLTIIAAGVITAALVYTKALMIPLVIALFFYICKHLCWRKWYPRTDRYSFFVFKFFHFFYSNRYTFIGYYFINKFYRRTSNKYIFPAYNLLKFFGQHITNINVKNILKVFRKKRLSIKTAGLF